MRGSERVDALTEIRELAGLVNDNYQPAVTQLYEWAGGMKSPGGGRGGGSEVRVNEKTGEEEAALTVVEQGPDRFMRDVDLFDASLELALTALREAYRIVLVATRKEKAPDREQGCRSCARHTNHKGDPTFSPVYARALCAWCSRWLSSHGAWPPLKLLDMHLSGVRLSEQLVERVLKGDAA